MDLVDFFKKNFNLRNDSYYSDFYKGYFISHRDSLKYSVLDKDDLVQHWKQKLYPTNTTSVESEAEFTLLTYWLYKNGFVVEGHPNILEKFTSREKISNGNLYFATKKKYGTNPSGAVTWKDRRSYIDELKIERISTSTIVLEHSLEDIMSLVSTRNAVFAEMTLDEKIANIRDVFEYIGKKNGKYLQIPFETLSAGYITIENVKRFQNEIQCFRHGEATLLAKRNTYSDEQKWFLIDYGLTILMLAYRHLKNYGSSD